MDIKEKQISEFERLERIVVRIVTKNRVSWGDFVIAMFSIIVDVTITGYGISIMDCKKELSKHFAYVLARINEYYGTKKKN